MDPIDLLRRARLSRAALARTLVALSNTLNLTVVAKTATTEHVKP